MKINEIRYGSTHLSIGNIYNNRKIASLSYTVIPNSDIIKITIFVETVKTSTGKILYSEIFVSTNTFNVQIINDIDNYEEG